jgi:hypothetical protein
MEFYNMTGWQDEFANGQHPFNQGCQIFIDTLYQKGGK